MLRRNIIRAAKTSLLSTRSCCPKVLFVPPATGASLLRVVTGVNATPLTSNHTKEPSMSWKAPKIVEIALGAEINSYACAEAKR
jgi:coenzyme PQQ precursor peptide PqqA